MENSKITIKGVNGVDVNKNVRCQFCGSDMEQGTCQFGSGTNSISYWCKTCGTIAAFYHNSTKGIKSIETKFIFEE